MSREVANVKDFLKNSLKFFHHQGLFEKFRKNFRLRLSA